MNINRMFRVKLGYPNADLLKKHFKGKDIVNVNWRKIELYNSRIKNIFQELNNIVHKSIQYNDLSSFNLKIDTAYHLLKENNIIPRLNNNGRNPEDVYYNWMRGYAVCEFFSNTLSIIFNVPKELIKTVGNDQLTNINTFSKSPTADLEIKLENKTIRLEIQSGFTGVNDIKEHKIREAKRAFTENNILSYIVHFDLFNGTMAIINITNINQNSIHWIRRAQMEGQRVFAIPPEAFKWSLLDKPPHYSDILF